MTSAWIGRGGAWPALAALVVLGAPVGPAAAGWQKMTLLDHELPDETIRHDGRDIVSGIWFRDLAHGIVATLQGSDGYHGGALFRADAGTVTGIAMPGYRQAADQAQHVSFRDLVPTPDGVVALLTRADTFIRGDADLNFTMEPAGGEFGVETQLALQPGPNGQWWCITGTGVVWRSNGPPARGATWEAIWFPEGVPPVPNPVPAGMCEQAAIPNTPAMIPHRYAYISPDARLFAYPVHSEAAVCVSNDGGTTWLKHPLPNPPESSAETGPYGIYFTDAQHGWTFYANDLSEGSAYVYRSTDGGQSWLAGQLPDSVTNPRASASFRGIFFAPNNLHGWLVGYNGSDALLLRTKDGGATWEDQSTGPDSVTNALGSYTKLYCGFALDADHIWVGGAKGALAYNDEASK